MIKAAHKDSFFLFQVLGYLVGGMLPVIVTLFSSFLLNDEEIIRSEFVGFFAAFTFVAFTIGFLAFIFDRYGKSGHGVFLLAQALVSIFFIHLLVLYTGGPKTSVFAMSYLYLPSIVGYTYGSKDKKLLGAVILLGASIYSNLFYYEVQYNIFLEMVLLFKANGIVDRQLVCNGSSDFVFFIIFTSQIIITSLIAAKRSLADNDDEVASTS